MSDHPLLFLFILFCTCSACSQGDENRNDIRELRFEVEQCRVRGGGR